jgi:hypothetical protein
MEGFVQHDIQEFIRVLLAKIEEKMAQTDRKDAVAEMFRGKFRHSISNSARKFDQARTEDFYDLSLQVRGFRRIEDSLRHFVSPEYLSGENAYDTGTDLGRIPVEIGVTILELPPVLQLHLKRFEYDLTRFSLIKIDDEFSFPAELDMQPYLHLSSAEHNTVYQLYAVLVHSGTAFGGHYYVYLRPDGGDAWHQFNDSFVEVADAVRALDENFGGADSLASIYATPKMYSAYMLFYVRRDKWQTIFQRDEAAVVGPHVVAYAEERARAVVTERSVSRSPFRCYSEDGLHANCRSATLGLTAPGGSVPIDVVPDATIDQLYAAVAEAMKCDVNTIRIWKFGLAAPLDRPLAKSTSLTVDTLVEKRLFVQRKPVGEDVVLRPGQIALFVKCYTRVLSAPLVFLGSCIVNSADHADGIVAAFKGVIGTNRCQMFREDPGSLSTPIRTIYGILRWSQQECVSGTVVVLQPEKPVVVTPQMMPAAVSSEEETTESGTQVKIHTYASFMVNKAPATFEEYYNLKAITRDVTLMSYQTMDTKCVLRLPVETTLEHLKQFVALALGADEDFALNDATHELLLFENRGKHRMPEIQPIATIVGSIEFMTVYYVVVDKNAVAGRRQTVVADYAHSCYRRSSRRCFYVELPREWAAIEAAMLEITGTADPIRKLLVRSYTISAMMSIRT